MEETYYKLYTSDQYGLDPGDLEDNGDRGDAGDV